jgi:DDE superfamily endonuclease
MGCIPPKPSGEFVYHMEDVLEVYHRPYDPKRPVVCLDETFKQLIGETRDPLPAMPGQVERYDSVYVRNGVASLFMTFEPLAGWRHVEFSGSRTAVDFAEVMRQLVDSRRYRNVEQIVLIMDQLNTHSPGSLYEAFTPDEAKRIADKLEIHYTPKHGSWLNMAEIELGAFERDLPERVGDKSAMRTHVAGWEMRRNDSKMKIDWQFGTADARVKLRKLYPTLNA